MSHSSALSRIRAIAAQFGNADGIAMDFAAANLANNCPAFWSQATSGNSPAGMLVLYVNEHQDVVRGLDAFERDFAHASRSTLRDNRFLDTLLPLNAAAAKSLAKAYDDIGTSFYFESELRNQIGRAHV